MTKTFYSCKNRDSNHKPLLPMTKHKTSTLISNVTLTSACSFGANSPANAIFRNKEFHKENNSLTYILRQNLQSGGGQSSLRRSAGAHRVTSSDISSPHSTCKAARLLIKQMALLIFIIQRQLVFRVTLSRLEGAIRRSQNHSPPVFGQCRHSL